MLLLLLLVVVVVVVVVVAVVDDDYDEDDVDDDGRHRSLAFILLLTFSGRFRRAKGATSGLAPAVKTAQTDSGWELVFGEDVALNLTRNKCDFGFVPPVDPCFLYRMHGACQFLVCSSSAVKVENPEVLEQHKFGQQMALLGQGAPEGFVDHEFPAQARSIDGLQGPAVRRGQETLMELLGCC